ncbi:MAG: hypothetical protein F4087_09335 [Gemmatimonadetes bacterium]|nr:hypothetical protein [Gemmatimonadota bacterium]MXX33457.1 hypothetical protein [Gemmatimonadota bacterium]MYA12039.1 hypothetical protein [Gemmatimonadota bacterium]MYD14726.1 hypothetical protein [Gemmatimonadota bacterium]MYE70795.1 hypothetical protein [Gemmatimonadota bacterium]
MIDMPAAGGVLRAAAAAIVTGAIVVSLAGQAAAPGALPARDLSTSLADTVSYKEDVLPIFQKRCARCHGAKDEEGEVVAEVSLIVINYERLMLGSEFGPVITAGDAEDSWLLEMITEGDMPPEGEGDKVPEEEIAVIRQWIVEGAKNN